MILCFANLGGAFGIFEFIGVDARARTPAVVLMTTIILSNML
jgi:hypothetical protein